MWENIGILDIALNIVFSYEPIGAKEYYIVLWMRIASMGWDIWTLDSLVSTALWEGLWYKVLMKEIVNGGMFSGWKP